MYERLDGCLEKLKRADEHLESLQAELATFREQEPYGVMEQDDPDTGEHVLRLNLAEHPDLLRFGVIVGDVVHNLRCSLDYLAWELAASYKGTPGIGTEFPIFKDIDRFCAADRDGRHIKGSGWWKIRDIVPEIQAEIERLQPYHRLDYVGFKSNALLYRVKPDDPETHPLWILQRLSNIDKHRYLRGARIRLVGAQFTSTAEGILDFDNLTERFVPLVHGTEITRYTTPTGRTKPEVNVDFKLMFDVALDDRGPAAGGPIVVVPQLLSREVGKVIDQLGRYFRG